MKLPVVYDGLTFDEALRLDGLVEGLVVCELKSSIESVLPVHEAQLISQLRLANKRLGFLINFNVVTFKQGLKRIIH